MIRVQRRPINPKEYYLKTRAILNKIAYKFPNLNQKVNACLVKLMLSTATT